MRDMWDQVRLAPSVSLRLHYVWGALSRTEAISSLLHGKPEVSSHLLGASFPFSYRIPPRRALPPVSHLGSPLAPSPQVPRDLASRPKRPSPCDWLSEGPWPMRDDVFSRRQPARLEEEEARRIRDVSACGAREVCGAGCVASGFRCLRPPPPPPWCTRVPGPAPGRGHCGGGCKARAAGGDSEG